MYSSKHTFLLLLLISTLSQIIWARCICDPADSACLNACVNSVQDCIGQCSKSNGAVCRNKCIQSHWTGASSQSEESQLKDFAEFEETQASKPDKIFNKVLAGPVNTVTKPIIAAYAPAPTPQGVMGQLIPFIVTALGGHEPYVRGHPGANGQPVTTRQPAANGQTGAEKTRQPGTNENPSKGSQPYAGDQFNPYDQPNANKNPSLNGQPIPDMNAQPGINPQPNSMNGPPGQPSRNIPYQPNMNGQANVNEKPTMNEQPNMNGQQPGANAQPTMVTQPTAPPQPELPPPAAATDPSLLTTHTTVLSLTTVTPDPSAAPSFVPSQIFHLSQGVQSNPSTLWAVGLVLLFTTYHLI